MLIGILSDSHDRSAALALAVELLRGRGAAYYIHCGDLCAPRLLDPFAGLPAAFVFGNNDFDRDELQEYAGGLGVRCLGAFGELDLGGKRLAVTHGDDARRVRQVLEGQTHDYLLLGHSHARADERVGRTHVINPGALHRANPKTVALLDTEADRVEFLTVSAGA